MQAVILAAGLGTRMGELTRSTPKPMLPLLGKPLLEWQLEMLPADIDEVILVVGYLCEQIESHFGSSWKGRRITYVRQTELNGTAGAIHLLKDILKQKVLITNGDDLYHPEDLKALLVESLGVLGLYVEDAQPFGLLEVNEDKTLLRITERPHGEKTGIVNTGAYVLDPRFFEYPMIAITEKEFGLPQTFVGMGKDFPIKVLLARAWQAVGNPDDIAKGEAFLKQYWINQ
ncbi:MAG: nucleotidyltransferase family protein [Patescibacteria group bacterium]